MTAIDPSAAFLGIDAGGSTTRWLLLSPTGSRVGEGRVAALSGHVADPTERARVYAALDELAAAARRAAGAAGVAAGMAGVTGLERDGAEAAAFGERLARGLGLNSTRVRVDNDMAIAYAAAFGPGAGVLLYAGTGSVAYHVTTAQEVVRAGGHGMLIDDAGGGFWIGQRALRAVLRRADIAGGAGDAPLEREVYTAIGGRSWNAIRAWVYAPPLGETRARLAALAPGVARAADAGDADAEAILDAAGRELARLAGAVLTRLGRTLPVAFAGGVTALSPRLDAALAAALPAGVRLERSTAEPVEGAARLARGLLER